MSVRSIRRRGAAWCCDLPVWPAPLARTAASERHGRLTQMIAGERHFALDSRLPAGPRLNHRWRLGRRLSQQRGLTAYGLQRARGIAQLAPGWLNVDQTRFAEQPRLDVANHVARLVGARRLVGDDAPRRGQVLQ